MSLKTIVYCDECGRDMGTYDYMASDGARYCIEGFVNLNVSQSSYRRYVPDRLLSTNFNQYVPPGHICSKACLKAHFEKWLGQMPGTRVDREIESLPAPKA